MLLIKMLRASKMPARTMLLGLGKKLRVVACGRQKGVILLAVNTGGGG